MLRCYCNSKTVPLKRTPDTSPYIFPPDIMASCGMICFDFDNTITTFDVLDGIIEHFSINKDWIAFEEAWKAGDIGSKECLTGQLRTVRATREALSEYLSTIPVDPYFNKLLILLRENGIHPVILSDSFSFFINYILHHNDVRGLKVYSNRIRFQGDRLIPSFPYTNNLCSHCAHCKTNNLPNIGNNNKQIIYIGDGLSDVCPANHEDMAFAKATLLEQFLKAKQPCLAFDDLGDIYHYFKEHLNDAHVKETYQPATATQR